MRDPEATKWKTTPPPHFDNTSIRSTARTFRREFGQRWVCYLRFRVFLRYAIASSLFTVKILSFLYRRGRAGVASYSKPHPSFFPDGKRYTITEVELIPHFLCLVEEHSSLRRPGSTRNSTRESARSGKKKGSTRSAGKHTTHVHVSPSDDVELDRRDTDVGRQRTRAHAERPRISTTTSPASSSTLTNTTSTAPTTLATPPNSVLDSKPKIILGDTPTHARAPHWNAHSQDQPRHHSPNAHASPSPVLSVNSPHPTVRPSLSLPTVNRSEADLPPAYEDVR